MVVLDASIINIALPQAQAQLGIDHANRHWGFTAYAVAFGRLLLLGGKIADVQGRKRVMTSASGVIAYPGLGYYSASKFAVEGLTEALWKEVEPLGLKVILVVDRRRTRDPAVSDATICIF